MTPLLAFVGLLAFAGASFFFALAESALFSLGKWQIRQFGEADSRPGRLVSELLQKPHDLLATIVLGNTLANAVIVATGIFVAMGEGWQLKLILPVLLGFVLFGTEVAPKALGVRAPVFWSMRVAPAMAVFVWISRPIRQVAQQIVAGILRVLVPKSLKPQAGVSDEEYQELLDLAHQQGTIAAGEKEIILQIIKLDRHTVGDVMRPRSQMACIPDDLSLDEMVAAAQKFKHRRLPVYDETPDTIVGVLNTRVLLLDPDRDMENALEFPSFVPESMNLLLLLKSLQRQKRGVAIVLDEFGSTAGLVTLEDILESIVGEIRGEGEPEGFVMEKLPDGSWRVSGTMRLEDFRREHAALPDFSGIETMGGLLVHLAEVVPAAGESVTFAGLKLTARVADDRRVRELVVEKLGASSRLRGGGG
ncbi:MAG: HlyC/CorC family transporter [Opitutaceae bacterium]|nr:HlyC/CorC family transporter [Verrucomicrobiales bacterium]